jgi:Fe-S-cluster containining protein
LEVPAGGACVFLENHQCLLHDVKPEQCRTFPFWNEYIGKDGDLINFNRKCGGTFCALPD